MVLVVVVVAGIVNPVRVYSVDDEVRLNMSLSFLYFICIITLN